jgi:hypothetical protein
LHAEHAATGPVGERVPTNRTKDYIAFALWFAGLSYLALWLVATRDHGLAICRSLPPLIHRACEVIRDPALPPGLHAVGLLAVTVVSMHAGWLIVRAARRRWQRKDSPSNPAPVAEPVPPAEMRWMLRSNIKPRRQFGLRGVTR